MVSHKNIIPIIKGEISGLNDMPLAEKEGSYQIIKNYINEHTKNIDLPIDSLKKEGCIFLGNILDAEDLSSTKKFIRPWKVQIPSRELLRNVEEINEKNNFIDYEKNVPIDKNKLLQYCLSKISPREACLLNPRVEEGILIRIMKYYGLNRKD